MTRRFVAFLFPGVAAAQTVTVITPCAPVLNKMPKPCNGQCPACGEMHQPVLPDSSRRIVTSFNEESDVWKILRECTHCRNAFWQEVEKT